MSVIGDIKNNVAVKKEGVTLHNYPKALAANAAVAANIINNFAQSGKRLGGQVMLVDDLEAPTVAGIYVAAGRNPTDKWVLVKEVIGTGTSADITPA